MATITNSEATSKKILQEALGAAKEALAQQSKDYTVECTENKGPKHPVFLSLKYSDEKMVKIGITHLVHLDSSQTDWENRSYEQSARTTEQVAQAILARIKLFFEAKEKGYYICEGTIFDLSKVQFRIKEDLSFSVDEKPVMWNGNLLKLTQIQSEGVIKPIRLPNGDIQLEDPVDQRPGKGIFINKKGEIYRG